jgi:oxalate decarboxylase/phosphoglucose isomerase-like protein (cupin superfamily)
MEGDELALFYFQSDKLTLVSSMLGPGRKSARDPGHAGAHEIVYCIQGEVILEISEGDREFVRVGAKDAALIYEGVPHTVYNAGSEHAEMIWCVAPSLGRPMIYD